MEQIRSFLEHSLLPTMLKLLQVTKGMAEKQSQEHAILIKTVAEDTGRTEDLEEAVKTLSESMSALSQPITDLVNAVNESNRLQIQQNRLLKGMRDTLADNTARLGVMNLALASETEDPGIKALYKALEKEGGAE